MSHRVSSVISSTGLLPLPFREYVLVSGGSVNLKKCRVIGRFDWLIENQAPICGKLFSAVLQRSTNRIV